MVNTMRGLSSCTLILFALCLSLAIMPAAADGDSFAKAYEDTLTVYGNANLDDIIDENDVEYVQGIIDGTEDETQFADANYDGEIDEDDIAQIEAIIAGEESELILLDMANRTVTVPMPVERIVSATSHGPTRMLVLLGAQDKIVACSYPTYLSPMGYAAPELQNLPDPGGSGQNFNVELAVSLDPDVIFISTGSNYNTDEIQEKSQVPTIAVAGGGDFWAVDMLRIIGAVTGNDERARDLITYTKEQVGEIAKTTSEIPVEDKPVVYCCGCCGIGKGAICRACGAISDIEFAGGLNVVESTSCFEVSKEQVIKWNPDVIIIQWGTSEIINEILSDPVLQNVNAVENARVYPIRIGGWGIMLSQRIVTVHYLAKLFYPDKFEDLDVEEEGNEIMEYLYGVDGIYTDMADEYNFYRWD